MTIEAMPLDRNLNTLGSPHEMAAQGAPSNTITASAPTSVNPGDVAVAVEQLQTAISKGPNPAFSIDYLSGLPVVTVRSNATGEVVFQLPDVRVVELARLVKDGASLSSLGLLNIMA